MSQRKRNQDVEERPNRKNRDTAIGNYYYYLIFI